VTPLDCIAKGPALLVEGAVLRAELLLERDKLRRGGLAPLLGLVARPAFFGECVLHLGKLLPKQGDLGCAGLEPKVRRVTLAPQRTELPLECGKLHHGGVGTHVGLATRVAFLVEGAAQWFELGVDGLSALVGLGSRPPLGGQLFVQPGRLGTGLMRWIRVEGPRRLCPERLVTSPGCGAHGFGAASRVRAGRGEGVQRRCLGQQRQVELRGRIRETRQTQHPDLAAAPFDEDRVAEHGAKRTVHAAVATARRAEAARDVVVDLPGRPVGVYGADLPEPEHALDQLLDCTEVLTLDRQARRKAAQAGADDVGHLAVCLLPEDPGVVLRQFGGRCRRVRHARALVRCPPSHAR